VCLSTDGDFKQLDDLFDLVVVVEDAAGGAEAFLPGRRPEQLSRTTT
jgi:hypothetical protein